MLLAELWDSASWDKFMYISNFETCQMNIVFLCIILYSCDKVKRICWSYSLSKFCVDVTLVVNLLNQMSIPLTQNGWCAEYFHSCKHDDLSCSYLVTHFCFCNQYGVIKSRSTIPYVGSDFDLTKPPRHYTDPDPFWWNLVHGMSLNNK